MTPYITALDWEGVLAPLGRPSADGRVIDEPVDGAPRTRDLPLPLLFYTGMQTPGPCGLIEGVEIRDVEVDGGTMRALWGHGRLDLDAPFGPQAAEAFARGRPGVGVELDDVELDGRGGALVYTAWRLTAAAVGDNPAFGESRLWLVGSGDHP